ncbi:MAG: DNA repair protein RecN [Amylibacter sp.]|nr:DNA repair protein RecN [Amylibacter sp.]
MLRGLYIRNLLLIDRLDLEFQTGLNVLTGETGAGKSILLDSLGFVLGWRGRADLVRKGADRGEVTAVFDIAIDHPVSKILAMHDFAHSDELILRRTNSPDGRKTAFINDRRVSGELLRILSNNLVELHGQHDDRGLLDKKVHRGVLDTFAGLELDPVSKAWEAVQNIQKMLDTARIGLEKAKVDVDFLNHSVKELEDLAPEPGEEVVLDSKRRLMRSAEKVRENISKASHALGLDAAEGAMMDALRWLETSSNSIEERLEEPIAALMRSASELADAQRGINDCLRSLDFDASDLEEAEERLFAIRDLARKHNILSDNLAEFTDELRGQLEAIDNRTEQIAGLEDELSKANFVYKRISDKLTVERQKAAAELDNSMVSELKPLKMERAVFKTQMTDIAAGANGCDMVAFTVATNPGAEFGPIEKIASGGELSRFLLALKICLARQNEGVTLIFDEIDRGVGGATADAVGRRLAALAKSAQILAVTHSPQVAAQGAHHWQVSKTVVNEVTTSTVVKLNDEERTKEIARMLAGDVITLEAEAAARVLLQR